MLKTYILRGTFLLCILSMVSCIDDKKTKINPEEQNANFLEDKIILELDATVLENDYFELYYKKNNITEKYTSENRVEVKVNGSSQQQTIVFVLEQHIFPFSIRIDVGRNKKQKPIHIKRITMKYNQGVHNFSNEEVEKFFVPNRYVNFDYQNMMLVTKVVDKKYDPYLASHNLSKFVNKLILY